MQVNEKTANLKVKIKDFFKKWIEFTTPFHKLNGRQQKVLALLLYHHYTFKKEITNNKILWKAVFDYDTKVDIYTELNMTSASLENIISQLRKSKVIIDNQITPVYIPELANNSKKFSIHFNFLLNYEN